MKATQLLHHLGQSLWLDNITRDLLDKGTLQQYVDELSLTGLTSNPKLPADGDDCEEVLAECAKAGVDVDDLAARLQDEGAKSFVKSWTELLAVIASKSDVVRKSA